MDAWISAVVVLIALGVFAGFKIFGHRKSELETLEDAKRRVDMLKAKADAELAAELQATDADRSELERIQKINDDDARLAELAGYINRRQRRK